MLTNFLCLFCVLTSFRTYLKNWFRVPQDGRRAMAVFGNPTHARSRRIAYMEIPGITDQHQHHNHKKANKAESIDELDNRRIM